MFVNEVEFNKPDARRQALGQNTRAPLVNPQGQAIAYSQTGGMIQPTRHPVQAGEILFRFAAGKTSHARAVTGGWWVAAKEFEKITRFAQAHDIHVAMAARVLCCVPPEWSDMGLMVRVKVNKPILAYRGLGNNVDIQRQGGGYVNMEAYNETEARRLHQLYIPGLGDYADKTPDQVMPGALTPERFWEITPRQANGGWIYI